MSEYVRVRDPQTGHEYTVRQHLVADGLEVIDKDALGRDHLPLPPLYRVPLGDSPAPSAETQRRRRTPKPVTDDPDATGEPDNPDGPVAGSEKEND